MATFNPIGSMDLERGWAYGSHTWKPGMDRNLKKLAYLTNAGVASRVTAPGVSAAGTVYIMPAGGGTYPNYFAISKGGGAYDVVEPREGMMATVDDEDTLVAFIDGVWHRVVTIGGTAPNDRFSLTTFHAGALEDNFFFFRRPTADQVRILAAGPHYAYAETAATVAANLVIAKNGTTIGTVAFAANVKTGVVTIGADVVFTNGQILTVRSGTVTGMQDLAVVLNGKREFDVS